MGRKYLLVFSCIFFLALFLSTLVLAQSVELVWEAPTTNTDGTLLTDFSGYNLYWGSESGLYPNNRNVGSQPGYTLDMPGAVEGAMYYFVVTAFDTSGNESAFSNEVGVVVNPTPAPVPNVPNAPQNLSATQL